MLFPQENSSTLTSLSRFMLLLCLQRFVSHVFPTFQCSKFCRRFSCDERRRKITWNFVHYVKPEKWKYFRFRPAHASDRSACIFQLQFSKWFPFEGHTYYSSASWMKTRFVGIFILNWNVSCCLINELPRSMEMLMITWSVTCLVTCFEST